MPWKHRIILGGILTLLVGSVCLTFHLTVISDPNEGWPMAVLICNTVGIWWVVLAMALFAFEHSVISWMVLRKQPPK